MTCSIEPEITGMSAWTGCRRSFVTVIASMDPRTMGIGLMPGTSCWIPIPGQFPAGGHGGKRQPAPAQFDEQVDDRTQWRHQPSHPARGYDHLRAARARLYDRPVFRGAPARDVRRPFREDRLPEVAGDHGGRAVAGGRVRRERLPVRQPADW